MGFENKNSSNIKEERLQSSPLKKKFYDPVKLKKLKMFTSLSKKKTVTTQRRTMILKADRSLRENDNYGTKSED